MSAFDPARLRESYAKFSALAQARQLANESLNLFFWDSAFGEVACACMIGSGMESTPRELLALTRRVLSDALASGAIDEEAADEAGLHQAASSLRTLALAEWIETGSHQLALFDRAYRLRSKYIEQRQRGKKKLSLDYDVFPVVAAACAAERFQDAKRFLESTLPDKKFEPAKSRTVAEFALALATRPAPHIEAAERFLRANLATRLEHGGYVDGASQMYLASLAGLPGSARELLERAPQYIRYLADAAGKKTDETAKPKATKTSKSKRSEPPPVPSHPRPGRIIASTVGYEPRGERTAAIWKETPDGWAVKLRSSSAVDEPEFVARRDRIVEIFQQRSVSSAHTYPSLRRATMDGETLSECARAKSPLPLEVAFSPAVDNWFDTRMVPTPPKLSRRIWKDALAVGALVNLRAISIDARETDKERLARGGEPYAITPAWFWTTALAGQLEALEAIAEPHDLAASLALFETNPRLRELILWFQPRGLYTACFWFERASEGLRCLVQSAYSLATAEWKSLLATALPRATGERLRRVEINVMRAHRAEESAMREAIAPHAKVDAVHVGVPLREL